jgi:hypothetical protein
MASESKKDGGGKARRDSADRIGHTRAIGALLPGIAGETLGRRGFAEGTIFRQWREIVGPDIAADCLPEKLAFPAGRRSDGSLQVLANGGAALELQHRANQILERVNGYLGYGAVAHLKIRQGRLPARKHYRSDASESPDSTPFDEPGLASVTDPKLKEALASFGHSIQRSERRKKRATKRR